MKAETELSKLVNPDSHRKDMKANKVSVDPLDNSGTPMLDDHDVNLSAPTLSKNHSNRSVIDRGHFIGDEQEDYHDAEYASLSLSQRQEREEASLYSSLDFGTNAKQRAKLIRRLMKTHQENNFKKFSLPIAKVIQVEINPYKVDELIVVKLMQGSPSEDQLEGQQKTKHMKPNDALKAMVEFWVIDDKTLDNMYLDKTLEFADPVLREIKVNEQTTHKFLFKSSQKGGTGSFDEDREKLFFMYGASLKLSMIGAKGLLNESVEILETSVVAAEFRSWANQTWES
jgi:hypothetical protein